MRKRNEFPKYLFDVLFLFLLFSATQAIDPFEGNLPRVVCMNGTMLKGCNSTLREAYNKAELPWPKTDQNINDPDTYFMLFTRRNKDNPEYLDACGGSLPSNTNFNPEKPVVIIFHGYQESTCQVAWQREMKIQLLCRDDNNVILVDYGWGNQLDYYVSIRNAKVVAKQAAFVLSNIMNQTGITAESVHAIGHSLGAHVAGLTGHFVYLLIGQIIRRITGLDPAGPGFINVSIDERLDKSDARLVDIIHTNAGNCLPFFGYPDPIGHADFYPNGGTVQLSCIPYTLYSFLKLDYSYAQLSLVPTFCFHKQSVQYFKVSINPGDCEFIGVECKSYEAFDSGECRSCGTDGSKCAVMGMDWEESLRQNGSHTYYLYTKFSCPYCDNSSIDTKNFPKANGTRGC